MLLLEGWSAVIRDTAIADMEVPPSVASVAEAQSRIGWDQLLKGRLSIAWSQVQQECLGAFDGKKNGITWAASVCKWMLQSWLELWSIRNGERHGRDALTRAEARRQQVLRELEIAHSYKDDIMPHHNWILDKPIEEKKQQRTHALRIWLGSNVPILKESYKERLATG